MRVWIISFVMFFYLFSFCGFAQDKWRIGIVDIKSYDVRGSSIANSIKKSSLLLLSRDFYTFDIQTNITFRYDLVKLGIDRKVDFLIYGVIRMNTNNYYLVLQLIDVVNKEVKLTRKYSFVYNPDEIFDTIDRIVFDFKEGIFKVIPKYEESLALEIRKKIEEKEVKVEIPGEFSVSFYFNSLFSYLISNGDFSVAFRYVNDSIGGVFGNGWFGGFWFSEFLGSIKFSVSENYNRLDYQGVGKQFSLFLGTKIFNYLGVGLSFLLVRNVPVIENNVYGSARSISFFFRPVFYLNFFNFGVFITPSYISKNGFSFGIPLMFDSDIQDLNYGGLDIGIFFRLFQEYYIEGGVIFENLNGIGHGGRYFEGSDFMISVGVSRVFRF